MAQAPIYFVYDGDPLAVPAVLPRNPGINDVGGGVFVDEDAPYAPDPETMPHAAMENQQENLLVAYGKVTCAIVLSITFPGGVPTLDVMQTKRLDLTGVSVGFADNGNGDTSITITAGKMPPMTWKPFGLTQNDDVEIDRMRAIPISNGVRVKTKLGATGTDCAFTIGLSGTS